MWWTREKLAETDEFAREAKALRRDYFNGYDSKEEVLTNYENYLAERLTLLQKARYVFSCIEELNEKLVNLEEIINNDGKQRFQITKPAKNYLRQFVKLNGHTCACNNLTTFKNAVRAITGNRNNANLLK